MPVVPPFIRKFEYQSHPTGARFVAPVPLFADRVPASAC